MIEHYSSYLDRLQDTLKRINLEEVLALENQIINTYLLGKTMYIIGNGGSSSSASHWACDFAKGTYVDGKKPLKAISLTDNMALITAIANDINFESVFEQQLKNLLLDGDLLVGISASGNSPNVVKAFSYANSIGAITFAVVGFTGGKMKEIAKHTIYIQNGEYGIVEDIHMVIDHMVATKVRYRIENDLI